MNNSKWFVYILRCADNSLYTGITTDVQRRVQEHNSLQEINGVIKKGKKGARYTRTRQPVKLVYQETIESRSAASKRERVIKQLKKSGKEALLNERPTIL